ncbi:MAG: PIN domain nuclease [Verrucomicrobia bacterium]|nr:PIN domain nuclease [Verrucomicrobiota bacterium]
MMLYVDSGVLVKLYCVETDSSKAAGIVGLQKPPFPFSHWQEIEVRNALRLKAFRKEISEAQLDASFALIDADLDNGVLKRPGYDLAEVFKIAEFLSARYALATGCRSLDILHVATAQVVGAKLFCSFDSRQRELARMAGLRIIP